MKLISYWLGYWPLLVTILVTHVGAFGAGDQSCGFSTGEDAQESARLQIEKFAFDPNFSKWVYWEAILNLRGEKLETRRAESRLVELENWLQEAWPYTVEQHPEMTIVKTIVEDLQSKPPFNSSPKYLPTEHGNMIGGCEAACIASGEAFLIAVHPNFLNLTKVEFGGSLEKGSAGYSAMRYILAHELSHAIHSYNYIHSAKAQGRAALPTELKGPTYQREHFLVDVIALHLIGLSFTEAAEILRREDKIAQKLVAADQVSDLGFRASCLEKLAPSSK